MPRDTLAVCVGRVTVAEVERPSREIVAAWRVPVAVVGRVTVDAGRRTAVLPKVLSPLPAIVRCVVVLPTRVGTVLPWRETAPVGRTARVAVARDTSSVRALVTPA